MRIVPIDRTKTVISNPIVPAIFEAVLVHDGVLIRVDAFERLSDGRWRLNEVKSSTRIKEEHLKDIALQAYVIVGAGLELADAHLVFINDKYTRDEEIDRNGLFCREDVSEDVARLLPGVSERIAEMHEVLCSRKAPDIGRPAVAFSHMTANSGNAAHLTNPTTGCFTSRVFRPPTLMNWKSLDIVSMRDVPNFPLKPKQQSVVDVQSRGRYTDHPTWQKRCHSWHLPYLSRLRDL